MHLAIVIPVYNEGPVIKSVIKSLPSKLSGISKITILAVDDGSTDNSAGQIEHTQAILVSHHTNLGVGCATATGLEAARRIDADIAVTFDGDGQHDPSDIAKITKPVLGKRLDLVIGTRLVNPEGMPQHKKVGNWGLNIITYLLSGKWTSDSQSGFKAFSARALKKMDLDTAGYEFCSEIILEATRKRLKIGEIPIKVRYTRYSRRKGQSVFNGVNIVIKLIFKRIAG